MGKGGRNAERGWGSWRVYRGDSSEAVEGVQIEKGFRGDCDMRRTAVLGPGLFIGIVAIYCDLYSVVFVDELERA